jgi:hypothetical protein
MKILSIIGILAGLALIGSGYMVRSIRCESYDLVYTPRDAGTQSIFIMVAGVFMVFLSAMLFKASTPRPVHA